MKTSYQKLRNRTRAIFVVVLITGLGLLMTGCGGSGGSAAPAAYPYGTYYGQMGSGQINGSPVAVGDWGQDVELRLSFGMYGNGAVAATGQVLISPSNPCGLPPGTYPVQTSQPGYLSGNNTVANLSLIANGQFQIYVGEATVDGSLRINSYSGRIAMGYCTNGMYFY